MRMRQQTARRRELILVYKNSDLLLFGNAVTTWVNQYALSRVVVQYIGVFLKRIDAGERNGGRVFVVDLQNENLFY